MKIGIIGGGQLARMLALAGYPLGLQCKVLDPAADACAAQVAEAIQANYDDSAALAEMADWADVITFDFENVPAEAAQVLAAKTAVYPPPFALATAQDRLHEKTLFGELDIPTPGFANVLELADLQAAAATIGLPAVLKTRRLGYDGKGQRVLRQAADLAPAYEALGDVPLILEGFVDFEREVSILAVRDRDGHMMFYPLTENQHRDGILRLSLAPHDNLALTAQAQDYARRITKRLDYVGLLAIEFFVAEGRLLANEMAPRVHNSGHWTIEGAETSQFENHLRAICGLPLGATTTRGYSAMVNCIGEMAERDACLSVNNAHYHTYGKQPRPGRKVGHITLRADSPAARQQQLEKIIPLPTK